MQGAKPWNTLNIAYSKVKQRSRRCFLVDLNSAVFFQIRPKPKAKKTGSTSRREHIIPKRGCAACLFAFLSSSTYLFTAKRRAADLYSATRFVHHRRMKATKKDEVLHFRKTSSWCTKAIYIRTFFLCRGFGSLAERNGLRPFFVVEGNQYFIVIEVNSINEGVNQRLPLFLLGQV